MSRAPVISLIAAVATDGAIGKGNAMPWHISEDLKYFKRVTFGKCVIMGRKTWESLGCRPLPGRDNIVISRSLSTDVGQESPSRLHFVRSLESAIDLAMAIATEAGQCEVFVIGGGHIYRQALEKASRAYITSVHTTIPDADVLFPTLDLGKWHIVTRSEIFTDEKSGLNYEFLIYEC